MRERRRAERLLSGGSLGRNFSRPHNSAPRTLPTITSPTLEAGMLPTPPGAEPDKRRASLRVGPYYITVTIYMFTSCFVQAHQFATTIKIPHKLFQLVCIPKDVLICSGFRKCEEGNNSCATQFAFFS